MSNFAVIIDGGENNKVYVKLNEYLISCKVN
jgi:hypothetical protein